MKFYAVKNGKKKGVYKTLSECMEQVKDYNDAIWCRFTNEENATAFVNQKINKEHFENYAYVDGSCNGEQTRHGYGVMLRTPSETYILQGRTNITETTYISSIIAELQAQKAVIKKALSSGIMSLTIYYDCKATVDLVLRGYKSKNSKINAYVSYIKSSLPFININYVKVKAHSGIEGNEIADTLARKAIGLKIKKEIKYEKILIRK